MITFEESMPTKSKAYNTGLDIFYVQFNDIFFYIEDENQENFFFCVLKKLFPDILLEKIFPLGGKKNVIEESKSYIGDKTKIYIVDKDFDDILNKIEHGPNLFYLDRYSIENYLIEKDSFIEYIIGERPRINKQNIEPILNLENVMINIGTTLSDLIILYIIIQDHCLGIKNVDQNHERFVNYNGSFTIKTDQYLQFKSEVKVSLENKDKRLRIDRQIKNYKNIVSANSYDSIVHHIPGKYLMKMIKHFIEHQLHLNSRDIDSFNYRVAEKCKFNSLGHLKEEIITYIN